MPDAEKIYTPLAVYTALKAAAIPRTMHPARAGYKNSGSATGANLGTNDAAAIKGVTVINKAITFVKKNGTSPFMFSLTIFTGPPDAREEHAELKKRRLMDLASVSAF
jgi:hypothetical protein